MEAEILPKMHFVINVKWTQLVTEYNQPCIIYRARVERTRYEVTGKFLQCKVSYS
jgi:hypothetical protein